MAFDWNLVVGPASLVVGTSLGWYLTHRSEVERRVHDDAAEKDRRAHDVATEHRRWQRDRRLDAYAAFMAPMQRFEHHAALRDRTDYTPVTAAPVRAELERIVGEIGEAVGVMAFVAPKPVAQMAMECELLAIEAIDLVVGPTPVLGTSAGAAHWSALGRWRGTWAGAAHADLEGHPIELIPLDLISTNRWDEGKGWKDARLNA